MRPSHETGLKVQQEVRITSALHHDNVARTYCCMQLDRASLLASEKVSETMEE
jgi:hypothetical protein